METLNNNVYIVSTCHFNAIKKDPPCGGSPDIHIIMTDYTISKILISPLSACSKFVEVT